MSEPSNPQEAPSSSVLKRIQNGTGFMYEVSISVQFLQWWHTTMWTAKMRENLNKPSTSRNEKFCDPKWDSTNRTAQQWTNYGQGAHVGDGKPFVFCLACNTILQHFRAFGVGTSYLSSHMKCTKCL